MVVVTVVIAHVWVPRYQVQIYSKTAGSSFRINIPDSFT